MKRFYVAVLLCTLAILSCQKEPAVVSVTNVTLNMSSVEITEGETASITATISPDNADNKKVHWTSSDASVATVSNGTVTAVKPGTATITATSDDGGKTASCVVTVTSQTEYVDLGLSVKWATCNLGATKPEGYGLYYQWGDTKGYGSDTSDGKYFYWNDGAGNVTYKWCNGSYDSLTKYNTISSYGTVDNKTVLDMEDDAARDALGGNWRMPTDAEWTELRENCTWTWTSNYNDTGVAGMIVTSKKSGYTNKSIFLPAAGFRSSDRLLNAGSFGFFWLSSLYTDFPNNAWLVYFDSDYVYRFSYNRFIGQSVRPVSD